MATYPKRSESLMTAEAMRAIGVSSFWKIRIVVGGNSLYVASSTQPVVLWDNGQINSLDFTPIYGTPLGTTLGYLKLDSVDSVSWDQIFLQDGGFPCPIL